MENCVFCLRNALSAQAFLQRQHQEELSTVFTLYTRLLASERLERHTGVLSDILQLIQTVVESNPCDVVPSFSSSH